ncbi:MAG TPA: hypothetical protein VG387_04475 [Rhizomicrobium sp.]|jgi:hypothetical protein|nr:hypothetical protein [Rhizomicrobium sp.]
METISTFAMAIADAGAHAAGRTARRKDAAPGGHLARRNRVTRPGAARGVCLVDGERIFAG